MSKQTMKMIFSFLMIASMFVTLNACNRNGGPKELEKYVASLKQTMMAEKKKMNSPTMSMPEPVAYKAEGFRSPFEVLQTTPKKIAAAGSPLQAYPLSMLQFVGTVSQNHIIFAFIMTPDKMIYQAREGDVIGDRNGKVISILPNRLNVMEEDNQQGQSPIQRVVTLELKDGH